MIEYIYKRYNVSILLYYYVCYAKYRRVIFDDSVVEFWFKFVKKYPSAMK